MIIKSHLLNLSIIALFLPLLVSCNEKTKETLSTAKATIIATEGNKINGTILLTETESGTRIQGKLKNISPGKHGFHVHQYGDCSSPDATSAGGHFNPENLEHGSPNNSNRHIGDLGNITADENGIAEIDFTYEKLSLNGENSIIGRAFIIHANEDDLRSQPTGAAGARLGCAVIGISKIN